MKQKETYFHIKMEKVTPEVELQRYVQMMYMSVKFFKRFVENMTKKKIKESMERSIKNMTILFCYYGWYIVQTKDEQENVIHNIRFIIENTKEIRMELVSVNQNQNPFCKKTVVLQEEYKDEYISTYLENIPWKTLYRRYRDKLKPYATYSEIHTMIEEYKENMRNKKLFECLKKQALNNGYKVKVFHSEDVDIM